MAKSNMKKAFEQKAKRGLLHLANGAADVLNPGPGSSPLTRFDGSFVDANNASRANAMSNAQSTFSSLNEINNGLRGANYEWKTLPQTPSGPGPAYTPGSPADPAATGANFAPTRTGLAPAQPQRRPLAPSFMPDPMRRGLREGAIVQDFTGNGEIDKDTVPAMLAEGEAVLPHKTVQALGGPEAVEDLIESTNGKPSASRQAKEDMQHGKTIRASMGVNVPFEDIRPGYHTAEQVAEANAKSAQAAAESLRGARAPQGTIPTGMNEAAEHAAGTAKTAASKPAGALRTAGRVLGPAAAVATGVEAGLYAANKVDSNPWWRGKATASDSNAELAGTPQHFDVQREERIAADDAWEKRNNRSLGADHARGASEFSPAGTGGFDEFGKPGDLERAMAHQAIDGSMYGGTPQAEPDVPGFSKGQREVFNKVMPTGAETEVPTSLRNGLWKSTNDVAGDFNDSLRGAEPGDTRRLGNGQGVASFRNKDGSYTNAVIGGPSQYTGRDGKPTTDWTETKEYAAATARARADKESLRQLQYQNSIDDIRSANPSYAASGQRTLKALTDRDTMEATKASNSFKTQLDLANYELNAQRARDERENKATDNQRQMAKDVADRYDKLLDDHATEPGKDGKPQINPELRKALHIAVMSSARPPKTMEELNNTFPQLLLTARQGLTHDKRVGERNVVAKAYDFFAGTQPEVTEGMFTPAASIRSASGLRDFVHDPWSTIRGKTMVDMGGMPTSLPDFAGGNTGAWNRPQLESLRGNLTQQGQDALRRGDTATALQIAQQLSKLGQ